MNKIKNKNYMGIFIIAVIVFLFVFASEQMKYVLSMFETVFMGIVIAYLLDGMVRFLNKKLKIKRGFAIFVVITAVLAAGALSVYFAVPFLIDTVKDLIGYISRLLTDHNNGLYNIIEKAAAMVNIDLNMLDSIRFDESLLTMFNNVTQGIYNIVVSKIVEIGSSVINVITSVIMAVYMLIEKDNLLNWFRRLIKASFSESRGNYVLNAFSMANKVFKKFIIGKIADSTIAGVLCYILFKIFGIEYAAVFSIITGVGNMIPYFGPIFFAIPVVLILLIINPSHALIALIIIIVVQQLDNNVIGPKILSDNIGVSAFWILFAVTVCGMAFGFAGMVVGVPLVVIIKNLIEDFVERRLKEWELGKTVNDADEVVAEVVVKNAEKQ